MEEFNIKTEDASDVTILYLDGFLDAHTSGELEKCFEELLEKNRHKIVVNFEKLSYISSAGLGVFMAYIENMRTNQGDIKLTNMSEKIYNIFDMLGFPILFEIYDKQETALDKYSNSKQD